MSEIDTPEYSNLSVDELDEISADFTRARIAAKVKHNALAGVRREKVLELHTNEAVAQVERVAEQRGETPLETAIYWLTEEQVDADGDGRDDPGHRIQAARYLRAKGIIK